MLLNTWAGELADIKLLLIILVIFAIIAALAASTALIFHLRTQTKLDTTHRQQVKALKNQERIEVTLEQILKGKERTLTMLDNILAITMDIRGASRLYEQQVSNTASTANKSTSNAHNAVTVNTGKEPGDFQALTLDRVSQERRRLLDELELERTLNKELKKRLKRITKEDSNTN